MFTEVSSIHTFPIHFAAVVPCSAGSAAFFFFRRFRNSYTASAPATKLPTPPRVPAMTAARFMPEGVGFGFEVGTDVGVVVGVFVVCVAYVVGPCTIVSKVDEEDLTPTRSSDEVEVVLTTFTRKPGVSVHCHS